VIGSGYLLFTIKLFFMNQSQIHLALTHIPVVLSLTGLVILAISIIKKSQQGLRISLYILITAGLFTLPVFFSGEAAEESVEHLPGVSEAIIEKHEELAKSGLWIILATAAVSLAAFLKINGNSLLSYLKIPVLLLAVISAGVMSLTAHFGGQIRHSDISSVLVQNAGENSTDNVEGNTDHEKQHDD
jgi:hypothetical protein